MNYLDPERLAAFDGEAFRQQKPYPWLYAESLLLPERYCSLRQNLPSLKQFKKVFGKRRRYGQASHDRYTLEYWPGLRLAEPWRRFIGELKGEGYRIFLRNLTGYQDFFLHFHWHYTPNGCSVSPHCDATWKLGSHIFYFNTDADWESSWGGQTVILDDDGQFNSGSAPAFEDFPRQYPCRSLGNSSLLFTRQEHSWHGVRPIQSPEGVLRKVFIVELRKNRPFQRLRTYLGV